MVGLLGADLDLAVEAGAHQFGEATRVVAIGLVRTSRQRRVGMAGVDDDRGQLACLQATPEPRRHGAGLEADQLDVRAPACGWQRRPPRDRSAPCPRSAASRSGRRRRPASRRERRRGRHRNARHPVVQSHWNYGYGHWRSSRSSRGSFRSGTLSLQGSAPRGGRAFTSCMSRAGRPKGDRGLRVARLPNSRLWPPLPRARSRHGE